MVELNNRPSPQEVVDASCEYLPIESREALMATMRRYPVLTRDQINTAYEYKKAGKGLEDLIRDEVFNRGDNPKYQQLLQNAFSDSRSITDLVVLCNLRLIAMIAGRHNDMEFEDKMQEGVFGLIQSAEKYEPELGTFSNYAVTGIRLALVHAIKRPYSPLRFSDRKSNSISIGRRMFTEIAISEGREPTSYELVQALIERGRRETEAVEAVEVITQNTDKVISLDRPVFDRFTIGETLSDDSEDPEVQATNSVYLRQIKNVLAEIFTRVLSPVEIEVLKMRFGFGSEATMTLLQVAEKLGVSDVRVFQLEKKALNKLSMHSNIRQLIGI